MGDNGNLCMYIYLGDIESRTAEHVIIPLGTLISTIRWCECRVALCLKIYNNYFIYTLPWNLIIKGIYICGLETFSAFSLKNKNNYL